MYEYLTYAHFLAALPWLLNGISLTAAYCLANSKVVVGRVVALFGAMGWSGYGLVIDEYSFFFANLFFIYIYASAVYRFGLKRQQYREDMAQTERENAALRDQLRGYERNANKELQRRQRSILALVSRARKDLDALEHVAEKHLGPVTLQSHLSEAKADALIQGQTVPVPSEENAPCSDAAKHVA
jgi:hypothetical protein